MKKFISVLLLLPFLSFGQVKYEAQLSWLQVDISPNILWAAMPYHDSPEADTIRTSWDRPDLARTFVEYNAYEGYLIDQIYKEVQLALKQRFGITISSMVNKVKSTDSTAYGNPRVNKSAYAENAGYYFVKLVIEIETLEGGPAVAGQVQDNTTLSPTIQIKFVLFDKEGKKVKKASAKFQSEHFVIGQLEDFYAWNGRTRVRSFKADQSVRSTFIIDLLKQGLGKLQEDFYK